jgi:hypothetical protein
MPAYERDGVIDNSRDVRKTGKPATVGKPTTTGMPATVRRLITTGKPVLNIVPVYRYDRDPTSRKVWQQHEGR